MRLDQWLWAVRVFKTRSLAVAAIKGGHVRVNNTAPKPAHLVRAGEVVTVQLGPLLRTLEVIGAPTSRVGAKLVPEFATDRTPDAEYQKAKEAAAHAASLRPKGAGRPTKKDRRLLERWQPNGEIDLG